MATRLDRISTRVHADLADASVLKQIGRLALAENTQIRRVVWVRMPSTVEPPARAGGTKVKDEAGNDVRIRVVYDRWENLALHIFAEDDTAAELLHDGMLAALHRVLGPDCLMGIYEWETEREGKADIAKRGPKIVQGLIIKMPVSDESKGLRRVEQFVHQHETPPGDPFNHS
jgi:hypothetical protein